MTSGGYTKINQRGTTMEFDKGNTFIGLWFEIDRGLPALQLW